MTLDEAEAVFRLAFRLGAECERDLRGGKHTLTTDEDAAEMWQQCLDDAAKDAPGAAGGDCS